MANYNSDYTGAQIDSAVSRANSSDVTAGTVAASKAVVVDSNKDITGFRHITATGTVTAANVSLTGNVDLGDASGDTVTITGSIDSNLIPATDDTYDLGSASNAWQDLFLEGDINFSDGAQIDVASGDFTLDVAGDMEFNADGGDFSFKDDSSTLATISSSGVVTGTMTITSASITDSSGSISFGNENLTTSGTIQYGSITDGSITITAFVDEDGMDSNSATLVPTQQSVKAYVDAQVTAQDLDFQGDSGGALNIDLDSETLTIAGGEGIDTSGSSNTITIAGEDATTSNKGIASFSSDNFSVSSGAVTIKDDGVILATETTGDYVQNITGGTGIDSTGATSGENIAHTLSVDLNELTTETSIADDDFIAMVDATDDASGKITFENLEDAIFASVSGDITITEAGVAQIANNAVDLTTHSTGNYVATIADSGGGGITVANSGAEGAAVTLELDIKGLTDDAIASGDFIAFSDEGESGDPANRGQIDDVATLFAGTGLTASSAVIGVDASQTQITSVGTLGAGAISSGFGAIDNGSSTANFGATTVDSLSVSDGNVTNVGDIALDSISPDGTTINVAVTDNTSDTFTIKQGSDKYFAIDTTNSGEDIAIGTGISGTAISIGHSTSVTTVNDNLIVTGDLTINGDTTTISTTNTVVADTLMELGNGTSGTPGNDSGIVIERGSAANAFIGFDESDDKFIVGTGTFTGASTGSLTITTGTLKANIEGNVTGNVTGNTSGTALTVTQAAQTAITSVGTLTALQVDNININGNTIISSDTNGHINLTPNGSGEVNISKVDIDAGTIDGATIATSDVTVGSGKTLDVSGGTLTLADDQIPMAKTAIVAGTGISLSTNTLNVDASQTGLESLLNTSLVAGRDADNQVKFSTDDQIIFRVAGGDGVIMKASGEIEATSLDISGDIDVDGTTNLDVVAVSDVLTVDKSISAGDLNTAPIVTFKNSQGSGHYTAIKFEGADDSGANTGFLGYMSHNTASTRRFVFSHDGTTRDVAINGDGSTTFNKTISVGASNGSEEVKANRTRVRHIDGLADASDYSHGDLFINHISSGNIICSSNVGIGTTSPIDLLDLRTDPGGTGQPGAATTGADANNAIRISSTGNAINEKVGIAFGGYSGYVHGGIYGVATSLSNDTGGDITIDLRGTDGDNTFTEVMRFKMGGNVGVGTTNPLSTMHIAGNLEINSESTSSATADIDKIIFKKQHTSAGSGFYTLGEIRSFTDGGFQGGLDFYTGKNAGGGSYASTFAMRISDTQDIGIGDTTPSSALTNFGSASKGLSIKNGQPTIALTDTDTGGGALYIANGGGIGYFQNTVSGATMRFYVESLIALEIENDGVLKSSDGIEFEGTALGSGQTGIASSGDGGDLRIYTNGAQSTTFKSDGRLVASGNTSSTSAINTAHTFYIDQADTAFAIDNESSGNAFGLQIRYSATGHGTSGYFISCYANPSGSLQARFIVAEDGDVTNANNSYGSISDQRVKKDITDANSQWDDIKALKIRNYKKDEAGDGSVQIGVVAQELEEAGMNGLVDEMEATDIDVENFPNINEGDKIKSVKYSVLYMKSIKALQEAMSKIETLESKVEALENA